MISVLVYLRDNDGCKKSEIYRDVCYSSLMPGKLKVREDEGLIAEDVWNRTAYIRLTAKGRAVAEHFADVRDIMDTELSRSHPIAGGRGWKGGRGRAGAGPTSSRRLI